MVPYLCVLLVFPLLGLLENNLRIIYLKREDIRNKSAYYILILVISLILFLFSSFRSENVGADLVVYKNWYQAFSNMNISEFMSSNYTSFGYYLINRISILAGFDFRGFLIIYNLISIALLTYIGLKWSKNVSLTYFVFLSLGGFGMLFCTLRQGLATLLLIISMCCIKENSIKSLLFTLIATTFHSAAIIGLFLLLIGTVKNKKILIIIITSLFFGVILFGKELTVLFVDSYNSYRGSSYEISSNGGLNLFLFLLLMFLISLFMTKLKGFRYTNSNDIKLRILFFGLVFQLLSFYSSIISRVVFYFISIYCVYFPMNFELNKNTYSKEFIYLTVIGICFFYFLYNAQIDLTGIIPYEVMKF